MFYFSLFAALRIFCKVCDISSRFLLPRRWVPSYNKHTTRSNQEAQLSFTLMAGHKCFFCGTTFNNLTCEYLHYLLHASRLQWVIDQDAYWFSWAVSKRTWISQFSVRVIVTGTKILLLDAFPTTHLQDHSGDFITSVDRDCSLYRCCLHSTICKAAASMQWTGVHLPICLSPWSTVSAACRWIRFAAEHGCLQQISRLHYIHTVHYSNKKN